ncbi:unnamed protein product [Effrenium voratum]|nr:unnamed protein product [Effrenium voratum]
MENCSGYDPNVAAAWMRSMGPPLQSCDCQPGYRKRFLKYREKKFAGNFFYECCTNLIVDEFSCELPARHQLHYDRATIVGVTVATLGMIGILLLSWLLRLPRKRLPLQPCDEQILTSGWVGDGAALHASVPLHKWCVTLQDLRQFRRLVMHAVAQEMIIPHDLDRFKKEDLTIGPSVYTVTDQFIKPVTRRAGKMSWALLKNPEGVPCDVFVTHAWAEGIFEFVDRLEHSWPQRAKGAYVCFLSNPQNLDISSLIASPMESPFAKALQSASSLLVLPNYKLSIYTRLWCVYEAFLAYTWEKDISTAKLQSPGLWLRVLRMACVYIASAGVGCILTIQGYTDTFIGANWKVGVAFEGHSSAAAFALVGVLLTFALCRLTFCQLMKQAAAVAGSVVMSMMLAVLVLRRDFDDWDLWIICMFIFCAIEVDIVMHEDATIRSEFLQRDFSGRLLDAKCSSDADRENITQELMQSGTAQQVEETVNMMVRMHHVTPELRRTASLTGRLGDVSRFNWLLIVCGLYAWLGVPLRRFIKYSDRIYFPLVTPLLVVSFVEGLLWFMLFLCSPQDRKSFAASQLRLWLLLLLLHWWDQYSSLHLTSGGHNDDWFPFAGAVVLGPPCLALSLAGPFRVARIPFVGPLMVQLLLGQFHCARVRSVGDPEAELAEGARQTAVHEWVEDPDAVTMQVSEELEGPDEYVSVVF